MGGRSNQGRRRRRRLRDRRAQFQQCGPRRPVAGAARRSLGQCQFQASTGGLPAGRPSRAGRRGAGCARSWRGRRQGQRRQAAAGSAAAEDGDREAEAPAGGPRGPEGRPEHEVRYVRAPPPRHRNRAGRRHPAAVLRARRRQAQSRHGRSRQALSRPGDHQAVRRRRQRRQAGQFRQGADRQGARLRRRGRRRHPAAVGALQAATGHRAHGRSVRDDRAAADPGAARHGDGGHQDRRAAPAHAVVRVREADGRA